MQAIRFNNYEPCVKNGEDNLPLKKSNKTVIYVN